MTALGFALIALSGIVGIAAWMRAMDQPALYLDRSVARHVLELAEESGWYEAEWRGVTLRIDRVLDGRYWVVRHQGPRCYEALCTRDQAEDEVVRWRRGAW